MSKNSKRGKSIFGRLPVWARFVCHYALIGPGSFAPNWSWLVCRCVVIGPGSLAPMCEDRLPLSANWPWLVCLDDVLIGRGLFAPVMC